MKAKLRRIRLKKTASLLSVSLVISAVIGGLYQDRLHFVYALSAVGSVLLLAAWLSYLRMTGSFPWLPKRTPKKAPFFLRNHQEKTLRKPVFMQNSEDFDDDLNQATSIDEDDLTEKERFKNRIFACAVSGAILMLLSLVIRIE